MSAWNNTGWEQKYDDGSMVALFEGLFKRGIRHGVGLTVFADGSTFRGMWKEDLPWGNGRLELSAASQHAPGSTYHGLFIDGLMDGRGTFTYASGESWSGEWRGAIRSWSHPHELRHGLLTWRKAHSCYAAWENERGDFNTLGPNAGDER